MSSIPNRWLHEFFDIMAQGRSGWQIHKRKDEPSQWLGREHRVLRHTAWLEFQFKLFKEHGINIAYQTPAKLVEHLHELPKMSMNFIEATEVSHEYIDQWYSSLSREGKLAIVAAFKYVIENPHIFFHNKLLYPEDVELPEFKRLQDYVKTQTVSELV